MVAIEISGLSKSYRSTYVIQNFELHVPAGVIFGFFGPNGAGKTTLIEMILDYSRPDAGSIAVFGNDSQDDLEAVHSITGVLPDGYDFVGGLSARRQLAYAIEANDATDDPDDLLSMVGLGDVGAYVPEEYSNGMRQRLALACALVGDPELLILDEPFSGLDPSGIDLLRTIIERQNATGTTVFIATHMIPQVSDIVDQIGILADGRLRETGAPDELRAAYDDAETLLEVYRSVVSGNTHHPTSTANVSEH